MKSFHTARSNIHSHASRRTCCQIYISGQVGGQVSDPIYRQVNQIGNQVRYEIKGHVNGMLDENIYRGLGSGE
jgi:hypothetical protein